MDIGSALSRQAGISEHELAELPTYRTSGAFDELDRQVIELAERLTATPADVPDDLYRSLREALGENALVELVAEIAWENYRARFNRAFDLQAQGYSEGGFCVLPARAPVS